MPNDIYTRTRLLLGEDKLDKLRAARILVVGVGGVGGYATEMLARAGVGKLVIVDGDCVDITNLNRQIIALHSTVGKPKVEVMQSRLIDINPDIDVSAMYMRYSAESSENILAGGYDYIIDAIDSVPDKLHLILAAKKAGYPIISAMGAGNRYELNNFEVTDIYTTSGDRLARRMRKLLREQGVQKLDVICTSAPSVDTGSTTVGSISYMPSLCGVKLAGYVINQLITNK